MRDKVMEGRVMEWKGDGGWAREGWGCSSLPLLNSM